MKLSKELNYQLSKVLTWKEINNPLSIIRQTLEDKVDSSKEKSINFNIEFPRGNVTIETKRLKAIKRYQNAYTAFMVEYEQLLDNKEKTIKQ